MNVKKINTIEVTMLFDEIYTYEPPSDFNIGFVMLMIFAGLGRVCGVKFLYKAGRSMKKENEIERTVANQKVGLQGLFIAPSQ